MAYGENNMTDYEEELNWDSVGSPVPLGEYDLELVKAEYTQDKNGKHMIKVQFKLENAYQEENKDKIQDRSLFENFGFTQQSGFRVKDFATAAEIALPKIVSKQILEEWAASVVGAKCGASIKHRDWQGQKQANIAKFFKYQQPPASVVNNQPAPQQNEEEQVAEERAAEEKQVAGTAPTLRQSVQQKPAAKPMSAPKPMNSAVAANNKKPTPITHS